MAIVIGLVGLVLAMILETVLMAIREQKEELRAENKEKDEFTMRQADRAADPFTNENAEADSITLGAKAVLLDGGR
jgi:type II secretory pathway pseudopilin PulG